MFDALAAFGPVVVVVDTARDDGPVVEAAGGAARARRCEESGRPKIFSLTGGSLPEEVTSGTPADPVRHREHQRRPLPLALDGNPETRWDGGAQTGAEVVTIDLGSVRPSTA